MSAQEWTNFLGVNTAFVAVLWLVVLAWVWLLRRAGRQVIVPVLVTAIAFGVIANVILWSRQPAPPAGTPDFVLPWAIAMTTALGSAFLAIVILALLTLFLGLRRMTTR